MKVIPFDKTIQSNFVITRARLNRTPFVGTSSENESQSYHENFVSETLQDPQKQHAVDSTQIHSPHPRCNEYEH